MKSFYDVFCVEATAPFETIQAEHKRLRKKYHPDIKGGNDDVYKEKFQEIEEAWDTLGDQKKREEYDFKNGFTKKMPEENLIKENSAPLYDRRESAFNLKSFVAGMVVCVLAVFFLSLIFPRTR